MKTQRCQLLPSHTRDYRRIENPRGVGSDSYGAMLRAVLFHASPANWTSFRRRGVSERGHLTTRLWRLSCVRSVWSFRAERRCATAALKTNLKNRVVVAPKSVNLYSDAVDRLHDCSHWDQLQGESLLCKPCYGYPAEDNRVTRHCPGVDDPTDPPFPRCPSKFTTDGGGGDQCGRHSSQQAGLLHLLAHRI